MNYYFIGIKGTGMSSLACMLHDLGHHVSGSDLPKHFFTEDELRKRSIEIVEFNPNNIPDYAEIIIGNAFLEDFPEVIAARNNPTCHCFRYHEFVGKLTEKYKTIAISGSHGKTTTTGLISSMLKHSKNIGWLIGDGSGHIVNDMEYFCLEACEFRRHFLQYHPEYAVITNAEIDHVDYFKNEEDYRSAYEEFSYQVSKGLIVCGDDSQTRLLKLNPKIKTYWYGIEENNSVRAVNLIESSDAMEFDVIFENSNYGHFILPFVGKHMLLNSLAAITFGILLKISKEEIEIGLSSFSGVKRRFVIERLDENIYVDDYAHHPTEVKVTIQAARKRFPNHKLVAVFKPHRASRVLYFVNQFADALKIADKVYLCDFSSIDDKQDGTDIDITYLQERINGSMLLPENEEGAKILSAEKPAVFLFMSSKDIYWLADLVKRYQKS